MSHSARTDRPGIAGKVILTLLLALSPWSALANPLDAFGLGARCTGLAGACASVVDGFEANYYNPAGLARTDELRIEVGYLANIPRLTLNDQDLNVDSARGIQGGLTLPGRLLDHRWAVSVALHLPDQRITRLRALPENQPRFVRFDNRPQRLVITTSVAFEVVKDLFYLGAGVTFLSDTRGQLDVTGIVDLEDAAGTTLISNVDVVFDAVRYPSAGLLLTPTDHLSLGVAFRDEFDLTLDIGLVVNADIALNGASADPQVIVNDAELSVFASNASLFSPRQVVASVAWTEAHFHLAFDLTWSQWSRFRAPTSRISIGLEAGDLPLSVPPNIAPQAPNFHDVFIPRVGGSWQLVGSSTIGLRLRAGWFFEPSPAPRQPGATNYVDTGRHGLTLGLGLRISELEPLLAKPLLIDISAQYTPLVERAYRKANPADPIGDFRADGDIWILAATTRLLF